MKLRTPDFATVLLVVLALAIVAILTFDFWIAQF
jgi:FtsZ-interacting cell division protein ZipA